VIINEQADNSSRDADSNDSDSETDSEQNEIDSDEPHNPDESMSGAERKLLRVISEFSEEHQEQIDARDQMESGIVSNNVVADNVLANANANANNEEQVDENDLSDLSQRIGDEQQTGGMPDPGDTLH